MIASLERPRAQAPSLSRVEAVLEMCDQEVSLALAWGFKINDNLLKMNPGRGLEMNTQKIIYFCPHPPPRSPTCSQKASQIQLLGLQSREGYSKKIEF